jgi:hypothetical protein
VTQTQAVFEEARDEGAILAEGYLGHAAHLEIGRARHRQGRADRGPMAGPGVVRIGVYARLGLGDEGIVGIFELPAGGEGGGQQCRLVGVEFDSPGDGIGPRADGGAVASDPVRRHPAVGIGRQDDPRAAGFAQPRDGRVHRPAPRPARMRTREVLDQDTDRNRERRP